MSVLFLSPMLTRSLRLLGAALLCATVWLAAPGAVRAQDCYSSGFGIPFGTVSTSGNTDVTASLPYNCQSTGLDTYFKVCLFFPGGAPPIDGVNPKKMQDYNGHYIDYNVYSDPGRTQIIGPPPTGAGYTLYTANFLVPGGHNSPLQTFNVYGRVPPVPAGTFAGSYQAQIGGIVLTYARSQSGPPTDCFQSPGGSAGVGFSGVTATVSNSCSIAISQAGDMDFGSASSLAAATDSTSTITLSCPSNTSWKLGLSGLLPVPWTPT